MIAIEQVDVNSKKDVNRFIQIPFRLYKNHPQWVPPIIADIETMMNPKKHPFYEHSSADFFIATRDGEDVGRIACLENKPFNAYHGKKDAEFYLFDLENDQEIANCLFERAFDWAIERGLDTFVGPKGFSPFDGYGIQVEGFEHRQMMTMMNYNYNYYSTMVENLGFEKEVDFISCYFNAREMHFPEKVHRMAERVVQRGTFKVLRFKNKAHLVSWGKRIGEAYNKTFINNWEYYPLTEREVKFTMDQLITFADPRLIKIITHNDEVVGFLFAFQDVSAALQRAKGKINPISIGDLLLEVKRTKWVSLNGVGILPEYQGLGGNILLYSEMEKTVHEYQFEHADLTQVAETAVNMRNDLMNVGGQPYKNHRVYHKKI